MRVKLTGDNGVFEVVNAETGERIEGVTSLCMTLDCSNHSLILSLCDFDVDVEMEAEVE